MNKKLTAISLFLIVMAIIGYGWLSPDESASVAPPESHTTQAGPEVSQTAQAAQQQPDKTAKLPVKSPLPENKAPEDKAPPLPEQFYTQRDAINAQLQQANNCEANGLCEAPADDPRAAMFSKEKLLVDALDALSQHYQDNEHEDQALHSVIQEYLASPLGRVQSQAIAMMQAFSPNPASAAKLIKAVDNGYDSKVMSQALLELQRYPHMADDIDQLLMSNLRTGSFYASRTIAAEIGPFLTTDNISAYTALAKELPPKAAKTKLLQSAIDDYLRSGPSPQSP